MYIQWCLKGIPNVDPAGAEAILRTGIISNWWREKRLIGAGEESDRLTPSLLDAHVNAYDSTDPQTGNTYGEGSAFISLTAGAVSRSTLLATNITRPARLTALGFATQWNACPGVLLTGWVVVALNRAVEIATVAEEVRELNTYQSWSAYQPEGEVTAKVRVPGNQIETCEFWVPGPHGFPNLVHVEDNDDFIRPDPLLNQRTWF